MPWKPNERIVGLYRAVADESERAGWHLEFETLTATEKAMPLHGVHRVGGVKPINVPKSQVLTKGVQKGLGLQTAAMGTVMSARGTSIAVANSIPTVWKMAEEAARSLPQLESVSPDVRLVQDFLRTEASTNFKLVGMLDKGVGVHHAGLSDDVRALMEWLCGNEQPANAVCDVDDRSGHQLSRFVCFSFVAVRAPREKFGGDGAEGVLEPCWPGWAQTS